MLKHITLTPLIGVALSILWLVHYLTIGQPLTTIIKKINRNKPQMPEP